MRNFSILAFGGNIPSQFGLPQVTIDKSMAELSKSGIELVACSGFYATPAFPAGAGPDFVNAAAVVESNHSAQDLLSILHDVEAVFGRERNARWAQRTLDIDLIAQGDLILPDRQTYLRWRDLDSQAQQIESPKELILPHPRLQDRAFVLVPMADVAPDWIHPVLGLSTREMLRKLPETAINEIRPV